MIEAARHEVAAAANASLTTLYWQVGNRVRKDARGIHVAEYLTELPPRKVLEDRLRRAIEDARNKLQPARRLTME
ncbi:MAG: hypothetical protein JSR66_23600 [Proteobacteria bacterium]|nr:hypothetical protein [Pseudomonadota bacterium]